MKYIRSIPSFTERKAFSFHIQIKSISRHRRRILGSAPQTHAEKEREERMDGEKHTPLSPVKSITVLPETLSELSRKKEEGGEGVEQSPFIAGYNQY